MAAFARRQISTLKHEQKSMQHKPFDVLTKGKDRRNVDELCSRPTARDAPSAWKHTHMSTSHSPPPPPHPIILILRQSLTVVHDTLKKRFQRKTNNDQYLAHLRS